ncbi:MAG: TRAP transporter substrate-binding protein [Alkalilacustris sp.]
MTLPLRPAVFGTSLVAGLAFASMASAQIAWDLANEYPPNSIHAQTAEVFIEALRDKTDGGIVVTAHHGAALGFRSVDHFDAVGDGALPLASSFGGVWSGIDPVFLISSLPFLAPSIEDNWALYQASRPFYEEVFEAANQVFLFATPWPPSGLWGNGPLDTVDALSGVRIRTFDTNGTVTLRAAGASPIQVSWADVVPQLSTGALDGVLTSADGGAASQLWEHQTHFTEVNYAMPLQFMHMNRDEYEALDDAQRAALREAAAVAEEYGWNLLAARVVENYETMEAFGMVVVTDVSAEFLEALSEAAAEAHAEWATRFGTERAEALLADFEAARQ